MSVYSVYDYPTRKYVYYEDGRPAKGTHSGAPPMSSKRNALGATPEQASWHLPMGAKKIGSGELARGKIAVGAPVGGMGDIEFTTPTVVIVAGLAYLAWRSFK